MAIKYTSDCFLLQKSVRQESPQWQQHFVVTICYFGVGSLLMCGLIGFLAASRFVVLTRTAQTTSIVTKPYKKVIENDSSISRPHVVLVIADDLGYNDVGYGSHDLYACTPNLDKMRHEGVELANLYAAPTCTPSRAALFTARYPIALGMQHWQLEAAAPLSHSSTSSCMRSSHSRGSGCFGGGPFGLSS